MSRARLVLVVVLATGVGRPLCAQAPVPATIGDGSMVCAAGPCGGEALPGASLARPAASPAGSSERRGFFADLFAPLGGDLRHFASRETAVWLALGGAGALVVHPDDRRVTASFAGSHGLDEALDAGSVAGGGLMQFGAVFGTYVVGRIAGKRQAAHLGADLVRAQAVSGVFTQGLKFAVARTRPDGSRYSFPSGHTSAAFATATVLQRHYGWKIGIPAYAVAGYVGGSRMAENRHFPSDVFFGAAVGIAAARAVTVGHGPRQFAFAPIAVRGGVGVALVHVGTR